MSDDPASDEWVQDARQGSFDTAMQLCGFVPKSQYAKAIDRAGPCPACGGDDRFSVHVRERVFNCRKCGVKGRDALALALVGEHISFVEACEALSNRPRPQSARDETLEERQARQKRRDAQRQEQLEKERKREIDAALYREAERKRLWEVWQNAYPMHTILRDYLLLRRIPALDMMWDRITLRIAPHMPYYGAGVDGQKPRVIHTGAAMIGAIVGADGRFSGLHITWLDLTQPKGKAHIIDPSTGEVCDSKKMRGSKRAGHLSLLRPAQGIGASRLIGGEGIETTLTVYGSRLAAGKDESRTLVWSFLDLGNLGGKALGTVDHPTLRLANGKPQRVASDEPDLESPALTIPDHIDEVITLGDSDSEPIATRNAHIRFAKRNTREGRVFRPAFAAEGQDFNDMILEGV